MSTSVNDKYNSSASRLWPRVVSSPPCWKHPGSKTNVHTDTSLSSAKSSRDNAWHHAQKEHHSISNHITIHTIIRKIISPTCKRHEWYARGVPSCTSINVVWWSFSVYSFRGVLVGGMGDAWLRIITPPTSQNHDWGLGIRAFVYYKYTIIQYMYMLNKEQIKWGTSQTTKHHACFNLAICVEHTRSLYIYIYFVYT